VAGNRVWFAHWSSPAVVSVPAVGQARAETVKLPLPAQIGVWAVAAGAGAIWATTPHAGALWRIDPKTDALTRIPLPFLPSGVTTDGNDVWVTVRKR
jgi:streptogramin lyase